MIVVFVFAIASTAANIVGPKILGEATTKLFEGVEQVVIGPEVVDGKARPLYIYAERDAKSGNASA